MPTQYAYNANLLLINVALWLIMLFLAKPFQTIRSWKVSEKRARNLRWFFFLFFIYCTFAFAEYDTYHTWYHFEKHAINLATHYEPFFLWLLDFLGGNYFLWRAVVWGIACWALYETALALKEKTYSLMISVLLIVAVSSFFATRGSSGHALAMMSFVLLAYRTSIEKLWWGVLGIVGLVLSFFLHKSNFLFVALMLVAYFNPLKLSRKFVLGSLVLFPFLYVFVGEFIVQFVGGEYSLEFGSEMNIQDKAMRYMSADNGFEELNAYGVMNQFIHKLPLVLLVIYSTKLLVFSKLKVSHEWRFIYSFTYLCVYTSYLFLNQNASNWIFERINFFAVFPGCFLLAKMMQLDRRRSWLYYGLIICSFVKVAWVFGMRYYRWS